MNVVANNIPSMFSQRQLGITNSNKAKSAEKLSSGYKINRAADDAAGLTISEKMRRKIRGLNQGIDNTQDGISMCQIADGALNEVHDMLHRLTELSVKSANETNTEEDRQAIQNEVSRVLEEIDRVSNSTEFNTIKIFDKGIEESVSSGQISEGNVTVNNWQAGVGAVSASGTPINYNESVYNFSSREDSGISINGTLYSWSDIKSANGSAIDNLEAGTYIINHNGIQFSLVLLDNSTLLDVAKSMNGVKATTIGAHESQNWTSTHSYDVPYRNKMFNESPNRVFNISENSIYFDDESSFSYSLSNSDWNSILNTSQGAENANYSSYNITLALRLADGSIWDRMPKIEIASDLSTKGNFTKEDFINELNGTPFQFGAMDRELYNGSRLVVSFTGNYQVDQSDGNINVLGPFPVRHREDSSEEGQADGGKEGLYKQIWIQSGNEKDDGMWLYFGEMNTNVLGIDGLNVTTTQGAKDSIDKIKDALSYVSESRSRIGAQQNRLEHTVFNEQNIVENTQTAESRIRDADMADEMVKYSKENILQQVGQSMLAQNNQSRQGILTLLQ